MIASDGMSVIDATAYYNGIDARMLEKFLDAMWKIGGKPYTTYGLNMYSDNWEFLTMLDVPTNTLVHHIRVATPKLEKFVRDWINAKSH